MTQLDLDLLRWPGSPDVPAKSPVDGGATGAPNATRAPAPLHALARVRSAVLRFCGERGKAWLTVDDVAAYARMPHSEVEAVLTSPEWERLFRRQWDRLGRRMIYRVAVESLDLAEWGRGA